MYGCVERCRREWGGPLPGMTHNGIWCGPVCMSFPCPSCPGMQKLHPSAVPPERAGVCHVGAGPSAARAGRRRGRKVNLGKGYRGETAVSQVGFAVHRRDHGTEVSCAFARRSVFSRCCSSTRSHKAPGVNTHGLLCVLFDASRCKNWRDLHFIISAGVSEIWPGCRIFFRHIPAVRLARANVQTSRIHRHPLLHAHSTPPIPTAHAPFLSPVFAMQQSTSKALTLS